MLEKIRLFLLTDPILRKIIKDPRAFYGRIYSIEEEEERFKEVLTWAPSRVRDIVNEVEMFSLNKIRGFQNYLWTSDLAAAVLLLDLDGRHKEAPVGFFKIIGATIFDEIYNPKVICAQSINRLEESLWRVSIIFEEEIAKVRPFSTLEAKVIAFLQKFSQKKEEDCYGYLHQVRENLFIKR